jgi:glycerol kinase
VSRPTRTPPAAAVGLDLGSTKIKAGLIDGHGRLLCVESSPAPPLAGDGLVREGDAEDYLSTARRVLRRAIAGQPRGLPLGLASQRSTFVIWDRESGAARTPMVSWQDRRAADWCDERAELAAEVVRTTGLLLSPHYAGPKLATVLRDRTELARGLGDGSLLWGNLDAWFLRRAAASAVHETDLTMAARTTMLDLSTGDWSDALLSAFGVPREALPRVRASTRAGHALSDGPTLKASLADQAAGVVATCGDDEDAVLITLGTGGFVLRPVGARAPRLRGYLTAPVLALPGVAHRYVLEGTVNGAGAALDRYPGPFELPDDDDPSPDAFCIPDVAGLGAPYWNPKIGLRWTEAATTGGAATARRTLVEGLLFRLRQVLDGLERGSGRAAFVRVSGGVAALPGLLEGLAALTGRTVERLEDHEASVVGAARLAAGMPPRAATRARSIEPGSLGRYLPEKYDRWRAWVEEVAGREPRRG